VGKNRYFVCCNGVIQKKLFFIFALINLFCGSFVQAMTLCEAVCTQNIGQMNELLHDRADIIINAPDKDGWVPLHYAAEHGFDEGLRLLLESRANVDVPNNEKCTALHIASYHGHLKMVDLLLHCYARVVEDKDGITPLHLAACGGHTDIVQLLFLHGADVNKQSSFKLTPLHDAAGQNCQATAKFLLYCGAHVDLPTENGNTPLYISAENGHIEVAEVLVGAGADILRPNTQKKTPLSVAGNSTLKNYLDRTNGATQLLFQAVDADNFEEVQKVFRSEISPQLNARDKNGDTPLHLAIIKARQSGNSDIVNCLLQFVHLIDFRKTDSKDQSLFNFFRDYALQTDRKLLNFLPNQGLTLQEEHVRVGWLSLINVGIGAASVSVGTAIAWKLLSCIMKRPLECSVNDNSKLYRFYSFFNGFLSINERNRNLKT